MSRNLHRPLELQELIALDEEVCGAPDPRLWEHVNEHAYAFSTEGEVEIERIDDRGGHVLRPTRPLYPGLPLEGEEEAVGRCVVRNHSERIEARQRRLDRLVASPHAAAGTEGFCPDSIPVAYLPKVVPTRSREVGMSARGGRVVLSDGTVLTKQGDAHSLIINGESRSPLRPTHYPYTTVCKLELWTRPGPGGAWAYAGSYATGFLIGRRTLLTSGHVFAGATGGMASIKVIPACWANRPVFGLGLVTWVQRRKRWHSDSGNDLQLCQLRDPVGDQLGYLGYQQYHPEWEGRSVWTMAGFPFDQSQFAMSVEHGIAVKDDDDGDDIELDGHTYDSTQIENTADEASGASGSPLFAWFGQGDVRAIGVHSGYEKDWTAGGYETWSCSAGGKALAAIGHWGRSNWDA